MVECPMEWMVDKWLAGLLDGWMVGRMLKLMNWQLHNWMVECPMEWMVDKWLAGILDGWMVGWMIRIINWRFDNWMDKWPIEWMDWWMAGWMIGWFVDWNESASFVSSSPQFTQPTRPNIWIHIKNRYIFPQDRWIFFSVFKWFSFHMFSGKKSFTIYTASRKLTKPSFNECLNLFMMKY